MPKNGTRWNRLGVSLKEALNERFQEFGLKKIPLSFKLPESMKEIQNMKTKEAFLPLYNYYNKNYEAYQKMPLLMRIEFNTNVSLFNLPALN